MLMNDVSFYLYKPQTLDSRGGEYLPSVQDKKVKNFEKAIYQISSSSKIINHNTFIFS